MKSLRVRILLLILFLRINVSYSQIIDDNQIVQYTIANGLSLSYITSLYQDKSSFIWVGTQDGLNRFDGYSFIQFRHSSEDSSTISDNYIKTIAEMKDSLWITTEGEINKFSFDKKAFYRVDSLKLERNFKQSGMLPQGSIMWINSINGIYKLDTQKGTINYFEHYNDYFTNYGYSCTYPIISLGVNKILVASKDGLFLFDKKSETYIRYAHKLVNSHSLPSNNILSIKKINRDSILIGTDKGLALFIPKQKRFVNFVYRSKNYKSRIFRNTINDIELDPEGFYWLATKQGLLIFDSQKKILSDRCDSMSAMKNIQKLNITCLLLDHSNALWLGTSDSYLLKISRKFQYFKRLKYSLKTNLSAIRAIYKDKQENLWIGSENEGIYLLDKNYKLITNFDPENSGLKTYFVNCFYELKNKLIIGTNKGLFVYDYKTQRINPFFHPNQLSNYPYINKTQVYSIDEDKQHCLWLGTSKGLFEISTNGKIKHYQHSYKNNKSLSNNTCYKVYIDKANIIWIATNNGLNKLVDPQKNIFQTYYEGSGKWGLTGNSVLNIMQDTIRHLLWISTENGVVALDKIKGVQRRITSNSGLVNDYVYATIQSNDSNLWLATNRGIVQIKNKTHYFFFDTSDGLQGYEFNLGASFKTKDGTLFFGGNNGVNYFNPSVVKIDSSVPKVRINSVQYSQKGITKEISHVVSREYSFFYKGLDLQISFILPDYTAIGKNYFKYKLIGLDEHWNYIGSKHSVNFAELPVGKYTLILLGANNHGVWGKETTQFNFQIIPGIFNSTAAYILYILIGVFLVVLGIFYITSRLRKENNLFRQKEKDAVKISQQREKLMQQNKNLHDSMIYAKRIIDAMMPSQDDFKKIFPDSFIVHKPKEVVSGDFFWITKINNLIYFAAVDCTGHGIPGAFMSIIGVELLQDIVKKQGITDPSKILNELSVAIQKVLSKDNPDEKALADGMDMSLCVFHPEKQLLYFAGAYNPLYLIRDNSLIEYKADRISVGSLVVESNYTFVTKIIKLEPNDIIYIFSDGYVDQFGGQDGKKFKPRRFKYLLLNIHKHHVDLQKNAIENAFDDWIGQEEQVDDVLVLGLRPITMR